MPAQNGSYLVFLGWPLAAAGWLYGSIYYFPWWLSRFRKPKLRMDLPRLARIIAGYGVFLAVVFLATSPR